MHVSKTIITVCRHYSALKKFPSEKYRAGNEVANIPKPNEYDDHYIHVVSQSSIKQWISLMGQPQAGQWNSMPEPRCRQ